MDCWKLLGIRPTADKRKIKGAYAKLLKQNHPEDKPQEYQSIREAYDQALMIAEYMQRYEDRDDGLSNHSALASQGSERVQPVAEQSRPPVRERDRVRSTQLEKIDSALAGLVPLLQRDDQAAIAFCQATLSEDFFQALDVRYEFEGRLLVTLLNNDLLLFAFLEYLAQEFEWDIDLERVEQRAIGHFDHDVRYSGAFYAVAHRYLAQMVRNALRVELESTYPWHADELFDEIDELLFTTGRESELTEFCKAEDNRELIESAMDFLSEHHFIADFYSFVPPKTLQWLIGQKLVRTVEPAQPIPYSSQTIVYKEPSVYRPLIWLLIYLVYVFIKINVLSPDFNSNFNPPASSRSGTSKYLDPFTVSPPATGRVAHLPPASPRSGSSEYLDTFTVSPPTIERIAHLQRAATSANMGAQSSTTIESALTEGERKAAESLQRAADQGNGRAREMLGILYYKNATDAQDYKLAVDMLTWAADQGSAEATFWLAAVFNEGKAVKRDVDKAHQLLDRSIELGSIDAMNVKGFDLIHGRGREMDRDEGVELLQKAADRGSLKAADELIKGYLSGQVLDLNYKQAFKLLERLAKKDDPFGQFWLSQLYEKGLGVAKDSTRAAQLLAKAKKDASNVTVNNFAWQLATQPNRQLRNGDLAVELMEHLMENPKNSRAAWIDTLAAAYAEVGKFDKAVQTEKLALDTLTGSNTVYQRRHFEAHLKLYQKGESL